MGRTSAELLVPVGQLTAAFEPPADASSVQRDDGAPGGEAGANAPSSPADAARGMVGQNIVCFAKDWDEDPTSNNHIMRLLGRDNRVLWLNSIATRKPNFRSG